MFCCSNPWNSAFVWGDGAVTHCCYSNIGAIGNIRRQALDEIWHCSKLAEVRASIARGDYLEAGCENYCRSFRWNQLYGTRAAAPRIPAGLGRVDHFVSGGDPPRPQVLGLAMNWKCNLNCLHCLSKRQGTGLTLLDIDTLAPWIEQAHILRFMGGELLYDKDSLRQVRDITMPHIKPVVFLNTNGQTSIDIFGPYIEHLHGFHLKYSFEGLGASYERIRLGGSFTAFNKNLGSAHEVFTKKQSEGLDWKLFLNYCVMRSNLEQTPSVIRYAAERNIPLVINTINGMRHIDENLFMYAHLRPTEYKLEKLKDECERALESYSFADDVRVHLEYIWQVLSLPRLRIPRFFFPIIRKECAHLTFEKFLYLLYKMNLNNKASWIYTKRKVLPGLLKRLTPR